MMRDVVLYSAGRKTTGLDSGQKSCVVLVTSKVKRCSIAIGLIVKGN